MVVIFSVAAVLIAIILALLLRSLVAPLYLMGAVVLGFLATLGASVYVNQGIRGEAGLSFTLPLIVYLFVVAIGTDYNILMIARLREEAREGNDPRTAADLAVEHAGPSVTSAGLILAGTFAAMLLAGVTFLYELGFAVSVGIILSAFVMALFLVPGLTAVIGHKAWWPGHGDEPDKAEAPAPEPGAEERERGLVTTRAPRRRSTASFHATRRRPVARGEAVDLRGSSAVAGGCSAAAVVVLRDQQVMADDLLDDEGEELLGEHRIQPRILGHLAQPGDLFRLSGQVRRRHPLPSLERAHLLGELEPLGQQVHESRVDVVDARAQPRQVSWHVGARGTRHAATSYGRGLTREGRAPGAPP